MVMPLSSENACPDRAASPGVLRSLPCTSGSYRGRHADPSGLKGNQSAQLGLCGTWAKLEAEGRLPTLKETNDEWLPISWMSVGSHRFR